MTSIFSHASRHGKHAKTNNARDPSTPSTTSSSTEGSLSSKSLRSAFCTRLVKVEDDELAAMALDTKLSIDWRSVMLSARTGPAHWRRVQQSEHFAVYTRQEGQRYGVLAVGMVPGCVTEILNVLQSQNSAQYELQMQGVFEDQFREGSFVHRVDVANEQLVDRTCRHDRSVLADLSVKTVTFNKAGWFSQHEEWCYLDSVYRHDTGVVEKFFTTMQPHHLIAGLSGSKTKYFHDIICGYLLRPGPEETRPSSGKGDPTETNNPRSNGTRVTFYAEFQASKLFSVPLLSSRSHSLAAADKTIMQRLIKLAESTARLTVLVRRQRLGVQVLIDGNRILPPMNAPCKVCTTISMVAKQCRLCGHAVCTHCSDLHERARQPRHSETIEVTRVRVCANCIHRVDQATYTHLSASSLWSIPIVPDAMVARPATVHLKDLLQEALFNALSPSRRAGVMQVIKCVLDQESTSSKNSFASRTSGMSMPPLITPKSSDRDILDALDYIDINPHIEVPSPDHRSYQIDTAGSSAPVPSPMPPDEATRLLAVNRVSISELQASAELEILCEVAAKEMGCMTSAISIIDSDSFHIVASNTQAMRCFVLPREASMCSHTIMEKSPLIVKHPEADIRFSKFDIVDALGIRYYCAFPLMGDQDQIIGAMCCINNESMDITESQFATFGKLTSTASKIVRLQISKRDRGHSTTSSQGRVAASA